MAESALSKSEEVVRLAREIVGDFEEREGRRTSLVPMLRKAYRLADLVNARDARKWLECELRGYTTADHEAATWAARMGRLPEPGAETRPRLEPLSALERFTADPPDCTGLSRVEQRTAAHEHVRRRDEAHPVLDRVAYHLHAFATGIYHEKVFSGQAEAIFESYRSGVDARIAQAAGDALAKVPSAYERLSEGSAEAISHALTTCRRILKAAADSLFPPTEEKVTPDGAKIELGLEQVKNRLMEYIARRTGSESRRKRLKQTLANLWSRTSAGVHADVTPEEGRALFLQTYLFLGELVTLEDPSPAR